MTVLSFRAFIYNGNQADEDKMRVLGQKMESIEQHCNREQETNCDFLKYWSDFSAI